MLKIKVTVPAACTGLGPSLNTLGLALALHDTFEFSLRPDSHLLIGHEGEGERPSTLRHPTARAAIALFQLLERAPAGLSITVSSRIPANAGLGDLAALTIGGLVGANNLLDAPLKREALIDVACTLTQQPASVVTSLLGGLSVTSGSGHEMVYRRLEVAALKVVLVVPDVFAYRDPLPDLPAIAAPDAAFNVGRSLLLAEALRRNDFDLLARSMQDHAVEPHIRTLIPGYDAVVSAAHGAGAIGVAVCGGGPALIAFTQVNHKRVEDVMHEAFIDAGIQSRTWTVNVDTQGVAISMMG